MNTKHKSRLALRLGAAAVSGALTLGFASVGYANEAPAEQTLAPLIERTPQEGPILQGEPAPVEEIEEIEQEEPASQEESALQSAGSGVEPPPEQSTEQLPEEPAEEEPTPEAEAAAIAPGAAVSEGSRETRPAAHEHPSADFTVTGIQPGAQRFYRESVSAMQTYIASVAGPVGVFYRLEAGEQVSDWVRPGEFAKLFFSPEWTGGYYTGEVLLTIRNNSDQAANVFVERRWQASQEGQLRVFPSTNRSELQITGDVMPVGAGEVFNVGLTITSAGGAVRFVRVDTDADGRYRTTVPGLEPGAYTVQAQTSWRDIPQFDIKGARVLAASEVPSISLSYEPETGPVNGWFSRAVGVRVEAQDADGIDWIRVVENGRPYQNVVNGSLLRFSADGRYELVFTARDALGNESDPRSLSFNLDVTDPTITRTGALEQGSIGRGAVAFAEFDCEDTASGVESCTISIDGGEAVPSGALIDTRTVRDLPYVITARDVAGRETITRGVLRVAGDTTPPVVSHSAQPAPNEHGWNREDVEVILDAHDADSGLASFVYRVDGGVWTEPPVLGEPVRVLVTGDGRHLVEWQASDDEGNATGVQGRGVHIDSTAPVVEFDASLPDTQIVQGSIVAAAFTCSDALSGVDSCVGSTPNGSPLPSDTLGVHYLSVTSSDLAGNTSTRRISYEVVRADGALVATATPEQPGNSGWWNGPVSVLLDPDPTTGAVGVEWRMRGAQTGGGVTDGGEYVEIEAAGLTTIEYMAVDDHGRRGPLQMLEIRIDRVAPSTSSVLEPTANARGWLRRDAVMHIDASDGESGLARLEYRVNGGAWQSLPAAPAEVPIAEEGEYAVEYRASDVAGNSTAVRSHGVRVDKTDPVVTIAPSIVGAEVEMGQELIASYGCSDALSGVHSCVGSIALGQPLPTDVEGDFEFTVTALDNAGNLTREVVQYTVVAAGGNSGNGGQQPGGGTGGNGGSTGGSTGGQQTGAHQAGDAHGLAGTGSEGFGGLIVVAAGASLLGAAGLAFAGARRLKRNDS